MFTKFLSAALLLTANCYGLDHFQPVFDLSDTQRAAVVQLNQKYNDAWFAQQNRFYTLDREVRYLITQVAPEPREIGVRAVEIENIRRDRVAKQTALQKQIEDLLTPAQMAALQGLVSAAILRPLASDAACANLVAQRQFQWFDTTALYPIFPGNIIKASRFIPSLIPPAPTASFCGSEMFPISVRDYLSLTDAQISMLFAASAEYNDFYVRKQNRLNDLNLEIADLTAMPGVDPVVLGLRYLEVAQIGQQIQDKSAQLRDASRSQLTPAQTLLVNVLDISNSGLIDSLVGCNLLQLPLGSANSGAGITGIASNCFLQGVLGTL